MNDKVYRDIDNFDPELLDVNWADDCLFMNIDGVQYLYLTLQQCMRQLLRSNLTPYHPREESKVKQQHLVNTLLSNDLNQMIGKLEKAFPSLTELVEDTD